MKNAKNYTLNIPDNFHIKSTKTTAPLLTAYGCVLVERYIAKKYVYSAVNIKTKRSEIINRRSTPLTTSGIDTMVEKMRNAKVAGAGHYEAERKVEERLTLKSCRDMITYIFNKVLPQHGFKIRDGQISLANHILDAINKRHVSLAEAEVGTGKTLAYLIPAILAKRGKLNYYMNSGSYPSASYIEMTRMPIVVATSSIALQKAIITDYIPQLSDILIKHGIIKKPLIVALRKGRNNYVCKKNLKAHITFERDPKTKSFLKGLLKPNAPIDIAEIDGINEYMKRRIAVTGRCNKNCPHSSTCKYMKFKKYVQSPEIDIHVCNHNYLLADIIHRAEVIQPLIPNYQSLIIDEAHKFLSAARSMYGVEMSYSSLLLNTDLALSLKFEIEPEQKAIHKAARKLAKESTRLFYRLNNLAHSKDVDEDATRFKAEFDDENMRHIRNIQNISIDLYNSINIAEHRGHGAGRREYLLYELKQVIKQTGVFMHSENQICWLETENDKEYRLCATPKDIDKKLHSDLWSKDIPIILTSGTLSAAGDFSRIKQSLGISYLSKHQIIETSKPSPFDYYNNSMLYISENMPYPDQSNRDYILATADEIEKLVYASHGHAAVLFTSYKMMDMVWEILEKRNVPFPMFRLDKGGVRAIEKFKQSGNGILFAAGALWEGIDIPGDILSMLIIVKLPFQAPDPISEYELSLCRNFDEYLKNILMPDMFIKFKQGYGRPIRLETDTAVIAVLDCRVGVYGVYRTFVVNGLPKSYITSSLDEVAGFYFTVKSDDYFIQNEAIRLCSNLG